MILSKTMGGVSLPQNTLLTIARDNVGKISGLLKDLEAFGAPPSGK